MGPLAWSCDHETTEDFDLITVAIPTLGNRSLAMQALRRAVDQVCATPFEVLLVDNGCDPLLAADVEELAAIANAPVRYVPVSSIGLHNARHAAARNAEGEVLAYIDDDVIVDDGWLSAIARSFADPTVHLVGGRCLPLYETPPPDWMEVFFTRNEDGSWWCGALTLTDLGDEPKDIDPLRVWGANFSIRKATLERVGGFHPDGMPWEQRKFRGDGETAVSVAISRLGLRAVYSPEATVRHRVPAQRLTIEYFERRAFLQGISDSFSASRAAGGRAVTPAHLRPLVRMRCRIGAVRRTLFGRPGQAWSESPESRRVREAHSSGYRYHQALLNTDQALRRWVMMDDYWSAYLTGFDSDPSTHGNDASDKKAAG